MKPSSKKDLVIQEFTRRRTRQLWAVGIAVFLLLAVLGKQSHPGLVLGPIDKPTVVVLEILIIAGFIAFSAANWRCPACNRYLGPDINRTSCGKCRKRLRS